MLTVFIRIDPFCKFILLHSLCIHDTSSITIHFHEFGQTAFIAAANPNRSHDRKPPFEADAVH